MKEDLLTITTATYTYLYNALILCFDYVDRYNFTVADKVILDLLVSDYFIFKEGLTEKIAEDFIRPLNPYAVKANLYIKEDFLTGHVFFFNFILKINIPINSLSVEELEKTSEVIENIRPWEKL